MHFIIIIDINLSQKIVILILLWLVVCLLWIDGIVNIFDRCYSYDEYILIWNRWSRI